MRKLLMGMVVANCLALAACSNTTGISTTENATMTKHKVNFQLPTSQRWDLVSVEQDANGYAKSYRSAQAKNTAADQSFYINYGRNIKTPLLESMHEVVGSLASTGCKQTSSKIVKLEKNILIFNAAADQCMSGRAMWQVFKVFNMQDGQYSIVYSANPKVVSAKIREQMKNVVMKATIIPF